MKVEKFLNLRGPISTLALLALVMVLTPVPLRSQPEDELTISLLSREFTPPAEVATGLAAIHATGLPRVHILMQFHTLPSPAQRKALYDAGIRLLDPVSGQAFFASVPGDLGAGQLPVELVRWIGMLLPEDKVDPRVLADGPGDWARNPDGTVLLKLSFFGDVSEDAARSVINEHGGEIEADYRPLSQSFQTSMLPQEIEELAAEDEIRWVVDVDPNPIETNDGSRSWTKTDPVHTLGIKGEGVNLGIWDSGQVGAHADFGGRVTVVDNEWEPSNHATHVAGTMIGDGTQSNKPDGDGKPNGGAAEQWKGHAPAAPALFSYDYKASTPADGGPKVPVPTEMDSARKDHMISVANNSWGFLVGWGFEVTEGHPDSKRGAALFRPNQSEFGNYTKDSGEYDRVVRNGLVIIFAAGNDRNNPTTSSTLAAALGKGDPEIKLESVKDFPAQHAFVTIDNEEIGYEAKDEAANKLTGLTRGANAADHEKGAAVLITTITIKKQPADFDRAGVPEGRNIDKEKVPKGYYTIAPPAAAKNIVSVGAIIDGRGVQAERDTTTAFSNWGPTDDGRIKPDVVAPGFQIKSTMAAPKNGYGVKAGTSMAAPAVSGIAALIIQDYRKVFKKDPLPSTVKDLLICGAIDLIKDPGKEGPDFVYGWGLVNAEASVKIVDAKQILEDSLRDGEKDAFPFKVKDGTGKLKITLVWDDPPADENDLTTLKNDLNLVLIDPSGKEHLPWKLDPTKPGQGATRGIDNVNNVEQVEVDNPAAGLWKAEVSWKAEVTQAPPQQYSLCIPPPSDLGDAPDARDKGLPNGYPTLLSHNGARHLDYRMEWLGSTNGDSPSVSHESDAIDPFDEDQRDNLVNADKLDDGVSFDPPTIRPGQSLHITVRVHTTIADTGFGPQGRYEASEPTKRLYLNAWADWDGDGRWQEKDDKILEIPIDPQTFGPNGLYTLGEEFKDVGQDGVEGTGDLGEGDGIHQEDEPYTETAGQNSMDFNLPVPARARFASAVWFRFRLDYGEDVGNVENPVSDSGLNEEEGTAQFGEVEDYVLDGKPPFCNLSRTEPGPPAQVTIAIQDTESGLATLGVVRADNAQVAIPPFTPGTLDPVQVVATKIDPSQTSVVQLRGTDVAGNSADWDPAIVTMKIGDTNPAIQALNRLPQAEGKITITNGDPGVWRLVIAVNGTRFKVSGLRDGQETRVDVSSAMLPGNRNFMTLKAYGKPGDTATIVVHD